MELDQRSNVVVWCQIVAGCEVESLNQIRKYGTASESHRVISLYSCELSIKSLFSLRVLRDPWVSSCWPFFFVIYYYYY